jgi:hypothetical protein
MCKGKEMTSGNIRGMIIDEMRNLRMIIQWWLMNQNVHCDILWYIMTIWQWWIVILMINDDQCPPNMNKDQDDWDECVL